MSVKLRSAQAFNDDTGIPSPMLMRSRADALAKQANPDAPDEAATTGGAVEVQAALNAAHSRAPATAIVDDRLDAVSFAVHVMLGRRVTGDASSPITDGAIVRMSQLIQTKLTGNERPLAISRFPAIGRTLDNAVLNTLAKMQFARRG